MLRSSATARDVHKALWLGAAAWTLIASCGALPSADYRTDTLDVAILFDADVCKGSLWTLEQSAKRIRENLSLDDDGDRLRIYWGSSGLSRYCDAELDDVVGCYEYDSDAIFGQWSALDHEMVHSFGARINRTDAAFEEGLAIALSDSTILDQDFDDLPDRYLGQSVEEFHKTSGARRTVGHFVRWLIDEVGIGPLLEMRKHVEPDAGRDKILREFERAFGVSMLEFENDWALHAPEGYEEVQSVPTTLLEWRDDQATLLHTLNCDDQTTFGPLTSPPFAAELDEHAGMYGVSVINITSPGDYVVTLSAGEGGSAIMKQGGCWVTEEGSALGFEIYANETQVLSLSACAWTIYFRTDSYTKSTFKLHLERVAT